MSNINFIYTYHYQSNNLTNVIFNNYHDRVCAWVFECSVEQIFDIWMAYGNESGFEQTCDVGSENNNYT